MNEEYNENEQKIIDTSQKIINAVSTAEIIYKRIILGGLILFILFQVYVSSHILIQTIQYKDYIKTDAKYSYVKEDDFFGEIYVFTYEVDGVKYEIESTSIEYDPLEIKYDKNDPSKNCTKGMYYENTSDFITFGLKVLLLVFLIFLFFNKKLLSRVHMSSRR